MCWHWTTESHRVTSPGKEERHYCPVYTFLCVKVFKIGEDIPNGTKTSKDGGNGEILSLSQ